MTAVRSWAEVDALPRHNPASLSKADIPVSSGVYAWYRNGQAIYVGKATSLRSRTWSQHLGGSRSLHTSAFRRNVAEHLGCGAAKDIYLGLVRLDEGQLRAVRDWIQGCQVSWSECSSHSEAVELEASLKAEFLPVLTKR